MVLSFTCSSLFGYLKFPSTSPLLAPYPCFMGATALLISDYVNDGHCKASISVLMSVYSHDVSLLPLTLVLVSATRGSREVAGLHPARSDGDIQLGSS